MSVPSPVSVLMREVYIPKDLAQVSLISPLHFMPFAHGLESSPLNSKLGDRALLYTNSYMPSPNNAFFSTFNYPTARHSLTLHLTILTNTLIIQATMISYLNYLNVLLMYLSLSNLASLQCFRSARNIFLKQEFCCVIFLPKQFPISCRQTANSSSIIQGPICLFSLASHPLSFVFYALVTQAT